MLKTRKQRGNISNRVKTSKRLYNPSKNLQLNKQVKSKVISQDGAGFFDFLRGSPSEINENVDPETGYQYSPYQIAVMKNKKPTGKYYSTGVNSETDLINNYESLTKAVKNYNSSYNKHLTNLITLDDINSMHGLENTFKDVVIKNVFKGNDIIDRSNPLLIRNYFASDFTAPKDFRKEHILSQIRFIMRKFNAKDELLVRDVDVELKGRNAHIKFRGLNGDLHEKIIAVDDNYDLDMSKVKSEVKDVLSTIKQKMDFQIDLVSDFELGDEDIEIPGLDIVDDEGALARRLKDLDMKRSLRVGSKSAIPLSQMGLPDNLPPPDQKNMIYGLGDKPQPKVMPWEIRLTDPNAPPISPDIGLDQGFGGPRPIEMKPFTAEEGLARIIQGTPTALPAALPAAPQPVIPGFPAAAAPVIPGFPAAAAPVQPAAQPTRDELETICRTITDRDKCKGTLGCFFDNTIGKCHRNMKS